MDEGSIKFIDKTSGNSEESLNNVRHDNNNSNSVLDNGTKYDKAMISQESASIVITPLQGEKPSTCKRDLDAANMDSTGATEEGDKNPPKTLCDVVLDDEENQNKVSVQIAEFTSPSNITAKDVDTNLELTEEIALILQSAVSHSQNQISTARDSGISLDNEEEIIFHYGIEDPLVKLSSPTALSNSDNPIINDKGNTPEAIPDLAPNSNEIRSDKVDSLDTHVSQICENEKDETIFKANGQMLQKETNLLHHDEESNMDEVDNKEFRTVVRDELVTLEVPNSNSPDNLCGSNSTTNLNTVRAIQPSLANDAKLVKFAVSTKSMNIMQSNAQFLNKSRNFFNFITEKSTNIMEKTLLPQNLAAKYNSMLRLTENNPVNEKRCTEETETSSDSVRVNPTINSDNSSASSCETSNLATNNVPKDLRQIDSVDLYGGHDQDKTVSTNDGIKEDSAMTGQKLFLKCVANGNNTTSVIRQQDNNATICETNSSIFRNTFPDVHSEKVGLNVINETCSRDVKNVDDNNQNIYNLGITGTSDSTNNIFTVSVDQDSELVCENGEGLNIPINATGSLKANDNDGTVLSSKIANSVTMVPRLTVLSSEDSRHQEKSHTSKTGNQESILMLDHPAYIKLFRDYNNLKQHSEKLSQEMLKTEMEHQRLAAENNGEWNTLQLETLQKTIEQLKCDLKQATTSQEMINKEYLLANKERESMVMKYAMSEKQLIDTQRAREYAERKANEALKEQELLHTKLKQVQGERTRICNILDGKCHELTDGQKEIERLKEELNVRDVKLKWTQNKLKTDLEAQKENQQKLDKAMLRINELKEECEQIRKESQQSIRKFQQSEENKVVTLDHQLKEQQARLILERHVTEDKEMSRLQLQKEVETLKQRQNVLIEENNMLSLKVQNLEKERLNYATNLSNLKVLADQRQKEIVDLLGKVSQLETLKLQLKHNEQLLSSNEAEIERLLQANKDLQADMVCCREREAHMLDFTQKLTDKNVRLQSEFTSIEAKNEQLELEQGPLHDQLKELSSKVEALEISLMSEKRKRTEECELLARHVAEQTQLARNLTQKLEDSQGENAVLRRKQQISVKEMTKELQQCKKRLDAFESGSPSNSLDQTSRTGSSSSLSTGEIVNGAVSDNSNSGDHILQSVEPDRQTLIDRIVKLQRNRVKQAEKLDFLEEHTRSLVNELQKKTKIIKNYILHDNSDAMGSNERDRNKAELAKHGGIMASVYNQRVSDDNMTLELSLEINQKLQSVLEDTLLKNITLKDSIDTLGGEIARLTMQNNRK